MSNRQHFARPTNRRSGYPALAHRTGYPTFDDRRNRRFHRTVSGFMIAFVLIFVLGVTFAIVQFTANSQVRDCTVEGKWSGKDAVYIATEQCGIVTPYGFDSYSNLFNLHAGHTYRMHTTGYVFPVLHGTPVEVNR